MRAFRPHTLFFHISWSVSFFIAPRRENAGEERVTATTRANSLKPSLQPTRLKIMDLFVHVAPLSMLAQAWAHIFLASGQKL